MNKKNILLIVLLILIGLSIWVIRAMDHERELNNQKKAADTDTLVTTSGVSVMDTLQSQTDTFGHGDASVSFTTSHVKSADLVKLEGEVHKFSGKNYYNKEEGYIFSVQHPEKWKLGYDQQYKQMNDYPMNRIDAGDSIIFEVMRLKFEEDQGIEDYMKNTYLAALYPKAKNLPEVKYNYKDQCAFFKGYHRIYGEELYSKVFIQGRKGFLASVRFPGRLINDGRVQELLQMVSTFAMVE